MPRQRGRTHSSFQRPLCGRAGAKASGFRRPPHGRAGAKARDPLVQSSAAVRAAPRLRETRFPAETAGLEPARDAGVSVRARLHLL